MGKPKKKLKASMRKAKKLKRVKRQKAKGRGDCNKNYSKKPETKVLSESLSEEIADMEAENDPQMDFPFDEGDESTETDFESDVDELDFDFEG